MTRFMLDALNPHNLPIALAPDVLFASYVDYQTDAEQPFETLKRLYPGHRLVTIATHGADAQIGDFEPGAMEVGAAPSWVSRQRRRGIEPWVYATLDIWHLVKVQCLINGVNPPLWLEANWSGGTKISSDAIGRQYATIPGRYDSSVLLDHIPGFDPDPGHDPAGGGELEDDMASSPLPVVFVSKEDGGAHVVIRWPNGDFQISRDGVTTQAFRDAGASFLTIPLADMQPMINKATL